LQRAHMPFYMLFNLYCSLRFKKTEPILQS
jgi:hypothetical protein